jgi:hypothetical protein
VGVRVERQGHGTVPEQLLDYLHVGPGLEAQGGCRVAQIVPADRRQACLLQRPLPVLPNSALFYWGARWRRKDDAPILIQAEALRICPFDALAIPVSLERVDGDVEKLDSAPTALALGFNEHETTARLSLKSPPYRESAVLPIDVAPMQTESLA